MTDEYEVERTVSRGEAATVLHGVADGVAGGALRLGPGDDERTVDVPEHVDLEVEFERGDGEVSLEVEVDWPERAVERDDEQVAKDEAAMERREGVPTEEPGPVEPDTPPTTDEPGEEGRSVSGEPPTDSGEPSEGGTMDGMVEPAVGAAAGQVSLGRFELFQDRGGEWRWRLVHRNGNVIATSGEGYSRKHNARKGLRSVMRNAQGADVTERDDE